MKKIILLIIFTLIFNLKNIGECTVIIQENMENVQDNNKTNIVQLIDNDCIRKYLIEALIHVETNNGQNLFNENENAIGHLQIRPVMIDDINRIIGYEKYSHNDAWNKKKSIEMFWIYQQYYNPKMNLEVAIRIWNGGPTGHQKTATLSYLDKVKFKLKGFNIEC
jgi:hypothetical protein